MSRIDFHYETRGSQAAFWIVFCAGFVGALCLGFAAGWCLSHKESSNAVDMAAGANSQLHGTMLARISAI